MPTMDEVNAPLKAAVRERLDATPADDHKMQGVTEPRSERKTNEELQQNRSESLRETYSEWQPPAYAAHLVVGQDVLNEWAEFTRDEPRPTVAEQTLQSALDAVRDRHGKYGPPVEHFGRTASLVNAAFGTNFSAADWALVMVLDKVARLRGPTPTTDGGVDIAGYGGCYEECRSKT